MSTVGLLEYSFKIDKMAAEVGKRAKRQTDSVTAVGEKR